MSVTTVRLQDDTMAWAKEYADFKGMSVTGLIAYLIEEARQDDEKKQIKLFFSFILGFTRT